MLDNPDRQHAAPPGPHAPSGGPARARGISGLEVAGEPGLAAIDLRRGVRRQDDPLPVSPSLQPLCRLRSLPSSEVVHWDRLPLDLLATARARLVLLSVVQMETSSGSTSVADIGGSSTWCSGSGLRSGALSAPMQSPATPPDDVT